MDSRDFPDNDIPAIKEDFKRYSVMTPDERWEELVSLYKQAIESPVWRDIFGLRDDIQDTSYSDTMEIPELNDPKLRMSPYRQLRRKIAVLEAMPDIRERIVMGNAETLGLLEYISRIHNHSIFYDQLDTLFDDGLQDKLDSLRICGALGGGPCPENGRVIIKITDKGYEMLGKGR